MSSERTYFEELAERPDGSPVELAVIVGAIERAAAVLGHGPYVIMWSAFNGPAPGADEKIRRAGLLLAAALEAWRVRRLHPDVYDGMHPDEVVRERLAHR